MTKHFYIMLFKICMSEICRIKLQITHWACDVYIYIILVQSPARYFISAHVVLFLSHFNWFASRLELWLDEWLTHWTFILIPKIKFFARNFAILGRFTAFHCIHWKINYYKFVFFFFVYFVKFNFKFKNLCLQCTKSSEFVNKNTFN